MSNIGARNKCEKVDGRVYLDRCQWSLGMPDDHTGRGKQSSIPWASTVFWSPDDRGVFACIMFHSSHRNLMGWVLSSFFRDDKTKVQKGDEITQG